MHNFLDLLSCPNPQNGPVPFWFLNDTFERYKSQLECKGSKTGWSAGAKENTPSSRHPVLSPGPKTAMCAKNLREGRDLRPPRKP